MSTFKQQFRGQLSDWKNGNPFSGYLTTNTIGFDPLFRALAEFKTETSYPPYNIVQVDDDNYSVEVAVAGFDPENIEVQEHRGTLTIKSKNVEQEDTRTYVRKGIASRQFEVSFLLSEHVHVEAADFKNGILSVSLRRDVPEEQRPKLISIERK